MIVQGMRASFLASAAIVALAAPAAAQVKAFNLPAQPASSGIPELARQGDVQILASEAALRGKRVNAVKGTMRVSDALDRALKGSGLRVSTSDGRTFTLAAPETLSARDDTPAEAADPEADVLITGTRIKGAAVASQTVTTTREEALDQGDTSLGDIIRHIPQNYGGGTNLSVGTNVPESRGNSLGGGTAINLRGLGSDATLTLLNGHRLAYGAVNQGIDISSIPLLAVDRIEIVPDGASALYGSDAVAGVANIILRPDYDGIETGARFGASTSGGNVQQQYDVLVGRRWSSGGFMAAYDYVDQSAIQGRQRGYTDVSMPNSTVYPATHAHSAIVSGHQALGDTLTFRVDGTWNQRNYSSVLSFANGATYLQNGESSFGKSTKFAIAPSLTADLGAWVAELTGLYGQDHVHYGSFQYSAGQALYPTAGCYCNTADSAELNLSGPLFTLGGDDVRVAVGGGYRNNRFHGFRSVGTAQDIRANQNVYYGFAELNAPLIGPGRSLPWMQRLSFSAAIRYEDYPNRYDALAPKLGLIASPTGDFDLKASWGKSFKAPILYQQYNFAGASIYPAATLGGAGYPANAAVLLMTGGNPALKPERARNWSTTLSLHPRALGRATLDISYFEVNFRNRVVTPITFAAQSLSNPAYAQFVIANPSAAVQAAALAGAADHTFNYTGAVYDPGTVVALVEDQYVNAGVQRIHGLDANARYGIDLGSSGTLTLSAVGSYLHFEQQIGVGQPMTQIAGYLFGPPHFQGRSGAEWHDGDLSLASYVNYTGGIRDSNLAGAPHVRGMTTWDLTLRQAITAGPALFRNVELTLALDNILNQTPARIYTTQPYQQPYDTTNYSPVGRFVSVAITKKW